MVETATSNLHTTAKIRHVAVAPRTDAFHVYSVDFSRIFWAILMDVLRENIY